MTYYVEIEGQAGYHDVIKVEDASDPIEAKLKALLVNVEVSLITKEQAQQICKDENIIPFNQDGEECELQKGGHYVK